MNSSPQLSRPAHPGKWVCLVVNLVIVVSGNPSAARPEDHQPTPEQIAFFEKNIQPIFVNRCSDCHSSGTRASGGLSLDTRETLLQGGKSGPALVPGKPDESLMVRRVQAEDAKTRMPKGEEPLTARETSDLRSWIEQGAIWPAKSDLSSRTAADGSANHKVASNSSYPRPSTPEQLAYFEKHVRPIFVNRCYNCHSDAFKEAGGLRVDVGMSIFAGGNSGPVIIPGRPEQSTLIKRVRHPDPKKRMPQESREPLPAKKSRRWRLGSRMALRGRMKPKNLRKRPPGSGQLIRS